MEVIMRKARTFGLLILVLTVAACVQRSDPADVGDGAATEESSGFSREGLDALNRNLQGLVDEGRVAGMVTMLVRNGEVAQSETFGSQDIEADVPMEPDTIFRIYSMTKPVTGVAMMILYEEGLWSLDDPVSKFVPEFADLDVATETENGGMTRVPADHPMTMRELMTHTGGLTYGRFSESAVDTMYLQANVLDLDSSLQTMIDKLARIPLRQQPGSLWHYSVSVDVQGHIVEKLSGQALPEFFDEHIFEPLGMVDTGFHVPADKAGRLAAAVYEYGPNGELVPSPGLIGDYRTPPGLPAGGGGLVSTASDYMRFARMLVDGGELDGVRILSPESVEFMHTNHAPTTQAEGNIQLGPGMGFGIDVAVFVDPSAAQSPVGEGTFWWAGAGGTWFWVDPANDLVFVGMAQHDIIDIIDFPALTQQWVYQAR
jgi:CubicO group peptidase (beta-lactamase class C family)